MKATLLGALAGCLLSGAASAQSSAPAFGTVTGTGSASLSATVTANTSAPGATIPANFVGLSGEVGDFIAGFYQGTTGQWTSNGFTGNAASFISLINLLGSHGVMRIGGGSADTGTAPVITSGMALGLNSFLAALGSWPLLYTLDLAANNSAAAASTASVLASAIGAGNIVFQFGNEPSLSGFTAAVYEPRWNTYYSAVTGAVSGAGYAALDDIVNSGFGVPITVANTLTPGLAGLSELTEHWYPFCAGTWASPATAFLFASQFMNQTGVTLAGSGYFGGSNAGLGYLASQGLTGSVPLRMSETNSLCSRGQAGMSDRAMAATWFLNQAIILASHGWVGLNIHTVWEGGLGIYNPVVIQPDNNFSPGTVFYGMYLFSKIEGQQLLPSSVGGVGVQAIATKGANGNANIIAVNDNVVLPVTVYPQQSSTWTTATVLLLDTTDGHACTSPSPRLGGQPINESGAWSGSPYTITNGQAISIPPCGAALIQIQP